jgi:hypothetical protein
MIIVLNMDKKEGDNKRKIRCVINGCHRELRRDGLAYHIKTLHKDYELEDIKGGRKPMVVGRDFEEIEDEGSNGGQVKIKANSKAKARESLNS